MATHITQATIKIQIRYNKVYTIRFQTKKLDYIWHEQHNLTKCIKEFINKLTQKINRGSEW